MFSLDDVVGHSYVVSYLRDKIEKDNIPRVIVLHGNPGLGKTSIAKILGVEINSKVRPEMRESLVQDVIVNKQSTSSVKLFNMSSVEDDVIDSVVSELNAGLSPTGRKVLILDEAHGMTKYQQDALLVQMDPPPEDVYVVLCTTDLGNIKKSLLSRTVAVLYLKNLSINEIKILAKKVIREKNLTFDIGEERFIHYLNIYTERQARNVVNFLANFEDNTLVRQENLETFIDVNITKKVFRLIQYLYSSMIGGVSFLQDVRFDNVFCEALVETCNVAMGEKSFMMGHEEVENISRFFSEKNPNRLVRFTTEVCGLESLERRRVISVFMRNSKEFDDMNMPIAQTRDMNVSEIREIRSIDQQPISVPSSTVATTAKVPTMDELFRNSSPIQD